MDDADLTTKLCEIIGALDGFAWLTDPEGPAYPADAIGVFYGAIGDTPDAAVGVRVYNTIDDRHLHLRRVQVRVRGGQHDSAGADRIAGLIFARFDSLSREGGISGIRRESIGRLGADQNGRDERTENYLIILDNQETLP